VVAEVAATVNRAATRQVDDQAHPMSSVAAMPAMRTEDDFQEVLASQPPLRPVRTSLVGSVSSAAGPPASSPTPGAEIQLEGPSVGPPMRAVRTSNAFRTSSGGLAEAAAPLAAEPPRRAVRTSVVEVVRASVPEETSRAAAGGEGGEPSASGAFDSIGEPSRSRRASLHTIATGRVAAQVAALQGVAAQVGAMQVEGLAPMGGPPQRTPRSLVRA